MLIGFVMVVIAGIIGASVVVGLMETGKKAKDRGGRGMTNRERFNMAKAAGVLPKRKEN